MANAYFGDHPGRLEIPGECSNLLCLTRTPRLSRDIIVSKYKGAEAKTQDNLLSSFGLGIDTNASGVGRFFVGFDSNRDGVVNFAENVFVIASGGNASFGSSYPK